MVATYMCNTEICELQFSALPVLCCMQISQVLYSHNVDGVYGKLVLVTCQPHKRELNMLLGVAAILSLCAMKNAISLIPPPPPPAAGKICG